MTNIFPSSLYVFARTAASVLTLAAALSFGAAASAGELRLLPDMTPAQIAQDTNRSFDTHTGISIAAAPTFDPFEQDSTLAGTAALRTGASALTLDGRRVSSGAFLDLTMIYTRPSDDPYDVRGFDRAVYISGAPVDRIHQDIRTLDCASNTTEVIYEDDYYHHYSPYGFLAGIYLALPRYRGHRGYWSGSSYRRPNSGWSDWRVRGRSLGYSPSASRSSHGYTGGAIRADRADDRRRRERSDDSGRGERHSGRLSGSGRTLGGTASRREYIDRRGVRTGNNEDNRRADRERNDVNRTARTSRTSPARRDINTRRPARTTSLRPTGQAASSTPAPIASQSSPTPIAGSGAAPRRTEKRRVKPVTNPRPERSRKSERSTSSRVNTAIDRSFSKRGRSKGKKSLNFFPVLGGYGALSSRVSTEYRCVREERVTLHIPQDRLDAARFDGMTLVLVDNAGRDVPVYLPPNYIEGFRQAVGTPAAPTYSSSPAPQHQTYEPQTDYGHQTPPRSYPQN